MEKAVQAVAAKYGNEQWINSYVAKGPIVLQTRDGEPWIVTSRKTPGYPLVHFVGRYILIGGNWRRAEDGTPLDLYRRELSDELGRRLLTRLVPTIQPFADYLEFYSLDDHGNQKMKETLPTTNGDVYSLVSLFGSILPVEQVQEELQILSSELNPSGLQSRICSTESDIAILTMSDLLSGGIDSFAAGDGEKLRDFLDERYGVKLVVRTPRGRSTRLEESTHSIPFAGRDVLPYLRLNPLRTDTTDPQSPFKKV